MALQATIPTSPSLPLLARLSLVARDIKLSHSVFALPFALLATFMAAAADSRLPDAATLGLIVVCMVLARTVAMTMNRWLDATLDAMNPRTAGRAIPSGSLTPPFVLGVAIACAIAFVVAATGFWLLNENFWPVMLSPFVLAWLIGYSLTKRFTWLCHLFLGAALAISPLAAVIAVHPPLLASAAPHLLATMVLCWVAGFDVIYALADVRSDRSVGVHSMPAKLGERRALVVGAALHLVGILALVALWHTSPVLSTAFLVGTAAVAALLMVEHAIVWTSGTRHLNVAFFTLNGLVSFLLGGLGIFDVVRSGW